MTREVVRATNPLWLTTPSRKKNIALGLTRGISQKTRASNLITHWGV